MPRDSTPHCWASLPVILFSILTCEPKPAGMHGYIHTRMCTQVEKREVKAEQAASDDDDDPFTIHPDRDGASAKEKESETRRREMQKLAFYREQQEGEMAMSKAEKGLPPSSSPPPVAATTEATALLAGSLQQALKAGDEVVDLLHKDKKSAPTTAPSYGATNTTATLDVVQQCSSMLAIKIDPADASAAEHYEKNYYASIPTFDNFLDLCNDTHYVRLPSDWCVLVADICGSTACIESGRYRDVNTVGAMCIAAVRNALTTTMTQPSTTSKNDEFPYCFGGDGASLVVRADQKEAAVTALLALKRLVKENYKLHLRVGSVPIAYLEAQGTSVQVARYEIVKGMSIAMFRGGGLALADATVKQGGELQETEVSQTLTPNLDGLSCRWQKIPNENGCVLALLVMSNPDIDGDHDGRQIYQSILHHLEEILNPNTIQNANPVNLVLATYKTAPEMIRDEIRMHASCWSRAWIDRLLEILLCHVLFYWGILQHAVIDAPAYRQGMRTHADHRKFDDMLRMVLDCSNDQADQIDEYLKSLYDNGRQVFYGTQRSKHTLMTCLLEDTSEGKHIHFVDGDSGGYALAAKQLKLQLGTYSLGKRGRGPE